MNLSDQMTSLLVAQRAYQLNVSVFERARDAYVKALEIGK
jgi:flagellar basal body rod protein FlgC